MLFDRQDFVVFKKGKFLTFNNMLFSKGNWFCGIYRPVFPSVLPLPLKKMVTTHFTQKPNHGKV